jgi:DNA-directed RNA polymerase subunit beta
MTPNFYPKKTKDKNKILDYSSNFLKKRIEILDKYTRSNQDTSLVHKPAVSIGDWVQSGDLLADSSASMNGELAIGKNIIVAYMPWEGYNYEDAILINERLVYDDVYTSIHIERYEIETKEGQLGSDQITREIPDIAPEAISHLDITGIAKVGSWIEEGDILVGKVTPINKKSQTPYQKLLFKLLDKSLNSVRDSSLRAPKGIKANVINVHILEGIKELNTKKVSKKNKEKKMPSFKLDTPIKKSTSVPLPKGSETSRLKLPSLKSNQHTKQKETIISSKHNSLTQSFIGLKKWISTSSTLTTNLQNSAGGYFKGIKSQRQSQTYLPKDVFNSTTTSQHRGAIALLINRGNNTKACGLLTLLKAPTQIENQNFDKNHNTFNTTQQIKSLSSLPRSSQEVSYSNKTADTFKTIVFNKENVKNTAKAEIIFTKRTNATERKHKQIPNSYITTAYTGLKRKTFTSKLKLVGLQIPTNRISKPINNKKRLASTLLAERSPGVNEIKQNVIHSKSLKKLNPSAPRQSVKFTPTLVHIYLAEKRKIQVGDKMAGRHGNKGIISNILPREDMPFLPDGTPIDIVLNPLGVPSRMNVGQIYECLLGLAGKYLGEHYKIFPFDEIYGSEASRSFVFAKLFEARKKTGIEWLFDPNSPGKMRIFDGRTSESFDQPVTIGIAYMLKLVHMVDDKIHARSTGPYSLVTQQPLRGRAKQGGQRLGEMEVWAIEGYGAAFVLLEMLTLKSDDMTGRLTLWSNIILNKDITIGTPESFKVLVCELQALCLDIGLFRVSNINLDSTSNSQVIQTTSLEGTQEFISSPGGKEAKLELSEQKEKLIQDFNSVEQKHGPLRELTQFKSKKKSVLLQEISNLMLLP